ncbi:hypothetical protein MBLNU457_5300t1 [Dothideomycetes sp. NU457]
MTAQPITPATPNRSQQPFQAKMSISQTSPDPISPQRSTPTSGAKQPVIKALPTVRDHTTEQLNPEGDEYIPRERDEAGERKVSLDGYLVDRQYRINTFTVPKRGQKLFMLATECARQLNYRDSYLLFNKNRSLYKIIASQEEKDNLIHQEILPYSYRSRQIAIVTARSMFRQFGSRVIEGGRRVRDDYWESKARKQGFTEEDAAGEKRPGAAKQRAAALAEQQAMSLAALPQGEVIYSNVPGINGQPQVPVGIHPLTYATLPGYENLSPEHLKAQDYPNVIRPRQEINGPGYQDRSQPSSATDILSQSTSSAEFNRGLTQQRAIRSKYLEDVWARPQEVPEPISQTYGTDVNVATIAPQNLQSPQQSQLPGINAHQNMLSHQQNAAMMAQNYQQQYQSSMPSQSPVRQMHQPVSNNQMTHGSPAMSMPSATGRQQTPSSYNNYQAAGGMWPPPQPSPHPMNYGQQPQQQLSQTQQSPMHPPAQLPNQNSMNYMATPMNNAAFSGMNRNMYQASPAPQQYGQQQGMQNMQNWNQSQNGNMAADWQRFQQ